ncbi:MAG: hypothetical protein CBARDMAM_4539 [uncultured Caballeronia sp.]|nr:MAG: hypothetical protein CBARDMAM_4539 [uncultured Caballeronia sp.]
MQDFFMPASVLFVIAGALAFYLAAPGQRWLRAPLPPRLFRTLTGISSLAAFVILSARAGCIAIVFTAAMACLTACPFIGVLLERVPGWRRFAGDTLIVKAERPAKERNTLSRNWLSKALAGVAGGFGLGIAASGLLACLTFGPLDVQNKFQVAMWLVPPVWIGVVSVSFVFRSGLRAWAWLGDANLAGFALFALARHFFHSITPCAATSSASIRPFIRERALLPALRFLSRSTPARSPCSRTRWTIVGHAAVAGV